MNAVQLIEKKKNGEELSCKEIEFLVNGVVDGSVSKEQMSAFLMAVCFKGLSQNETFSLTKTMLESGDTISLQDFFDGEKNLCVDKHSTGGVADTTSLVLIGILSACGVKMLKMSGKSLGHTGGTVDKIAVFKGFNSSLTSKKALELCKKNHVCLLEQTQNLAPADKLLYQLRDQTGTVNNHSLIAASIMSKKLACGSGLLLLDVKVGSGAFMKTKKQAKKLAVEMMKIGKHFGKEVACFISDMDQPLGRNIGNHFEALEAVEILKGEKKGRLLELCTQMCCWFVSRVKNLSFAESKKMVEQSIASGKAFAAFKNVIESQNGDFSPIETDQNMALVCAQKKGRVAKFNNELVGNVCRDLEKQSPNGGICVCVEIGNAVEEGSELLKVFAKNKEIANRVASQLQNAITIEKRAKAKKLILEIVQ